MPYTTHGHWYGEPSNGDRGTPPRLVARCGGPHVCSQCAAEAHQAASAPAAADARPRRFRLKQAAELEAAQLISVDDVQIRDWLDQHGALVYVETDHLCIPGPHGTVPVEVGEWIIRGITGAFFKVSDQEFRDTYVPADCPEQEDR